MPAINTPFEKVLSDGINKHIEQIIQEEAAEAAKRVEKRVRGDVAVIAANVLKQFEMERMGDVLTIRVRFSDTKL